MNLTVIWGDNEELIRSFSSGYIGSYSVEAGAFITDSTVASQIEEKYDAETEYLIFSDLRDYLESKFEEKVIKISIPFAVQKAIEIDLRNNVGIAIQPYVEYPDKETEIQNLMKSDDWYLEIYHDTQEILLQVFLDGVKGEVEGILSQLQ